MTSGNHAETGAATRETTSGNNAAGQVSAGGDEQLSVAMAAELARYQRALATAPLSPDTRRKYAARVRGFLAWLETSGRDPLLDGDPIADPAARDGAVRDWRAWAKTVPRHRATTINNTLAAIDDFYTRRGLGPAAARRETLPRAAPQALSRREVLRYLRAVEHLEHPRDGAPSPAVAARDRVVALLPYYAGLRVGEVAGLDVDDVALSARKGHLRVRGKGRDGGKLRSIPLERPELRGALAAWLTHRPSWPAAADGPALLLNRRGGRLSDRSARTIVTTLGEQAGLGDPADAHGFGPHVLRHTFATELLRAGADVVLVADLLGHTSTDTLRIYTAPTDTDRAHALGLLTTDA